MSRRTVVVVGIAVLAIAGFGAWFWPKAQDEPVYRGKTLSAWLDERYEPYPGSAELTIPPSAVLTKEAEAAVRAIGTRAIPSLMNWLRASDSSGNQIASIVVGRLRVPLRVSGSYELQTRAAYGLAALGPVAKPVFPEIAAIALKDAQNEGQRVNAINSLLNSDADTMRLLAAGLKNPDCNIRLSAISALFHIRVAPDEVCLPALEGALEDQDAHVRASACRAITQFEEELEACAAGLEQDDPRYRARAARILGSYRTRARKYLPNLEGAADDDPDVRTAIAEAIQQIRGRESTPGSDPAIERKR
jgi:HEAT repeat